MQVEEIKEKITPALIKHKISRAGVFGSMATGLADSESDIDLLVEFSEKISLLEFVRIKFELEEILGKQVDLVEYQAIKPRLLPRILSEEIRIHESEENSIHNF
ncbi:MAG: nucleotidyltransferase family protein [Lewinella sp.]|nr:nucleotidyltransferase family protein [Lewinella sp.]